MKTKVAEGQTYRYTNATGSAIAAGAAVIIGNRVGVASVDIANTASGSVAMAGVFKLPLATGLAVAQGAALYATATSAPLTTTATNNKFAGYAYKAVATAVDEVECDLQPGAPGPAGA